MCVYVFQIHDSMEYEIMNIEHIWTHDFMEWMMLRVGALLKNYTAHFRALYNVPTFHKKK